MSDVRIAVSGSYDLRIPAARVPPFRIIYNPESIINVSVFATAEAKASKVITVFVQGVTYTSVIVDLLPAFAPVRK